MQVTNLFPNSTVSTSNVNNSTPVAVDPTNALSEASEWQHQSGPLFSATPLTLVTTTLPTAATTNVVCHTALPGVCPDVLLLPVLPRIKENIISGEFVYLATLLPSAMFLGSAEVETSRSLTL